MEPEQALKLVKADTSLSKELSLFFKDSHYPAQTTIEINRKLKFFNHYDIQADDHVTYVLLNDENEISGLATLMFKEAWIEGEKQVIGYATDLRVSKERKAILSWTDHFLPVLEKEKKQRNCKYVFTFISDKQSKAYNAFIRPRKTNRPIPRYFLYRKYQYVFLHGLLPFAHDRLPGLTFRKAEYSDRDKLIKYLYKKKAGKPIRFIDSQTDVLRRINKLPYFELDDFVLALDYKNNIIGCVAPWTLPTTEFKIANYNNKLAQSAKQSLKFLSYLGFTKPLPNSGEVLNLNFLTHFQADNPDIFYSLLHFTYEHSNKKELITYRHFKGHLNTFPPKMFIHSTLRFGLYCMLSPEDPVPSFLKPSPYKEPPDFDSPFLF